MLAVLRRRAMATLGASRALRQQQQQQRQKASSGIVAAKLGEEGAAPSTRVGKVVNTGKTIGQGAIVAGGLALLGVAGYFIFQEMWSSNSPLSLFGAISDKLVADKRVQNAIGHPVVAATSRTGRRSYTVAQTQGVDSDGKKTMEIYYYLKGGVGNASVVSQFVLEKGSYVHRMSVVDTNAFGRRQQILIEN